MSISIRFKIMVLIAASLVASLASYLYVGTRLMVEDRTSYIYDYTLTQVRAASEIIEGRIQGLHTALNLFTQSVNSKADITQEAPATDLAFLTEQGHIIRNFSKKPSYMESMIHQARINGSVFAGKNVRVLFIPGLAGKGIIPVAFKLSDPFGKTNIAFAALEIDPKLFEERGQNISFRLIDRDGNIIFQVRRVDQVGDEAQKIDTRKMPEFQSGAQERVIGKRKFIVAYHRQTDTGLLMTGFVSKDEAFKGTKVLFRRSVALGVSILLIAAGLTLILAKSITVRLRQLWMMSHKVGEGDFSARIALKSNRQRAGDEVHDLALSFNGMAEKIGDLMVQTAEKARMEKELETARAIQNQFFPRAGLDRRNFRVAGKTVAATECAGDWWHYAEIGRYLLVAVGDVTGHGVSSALVAAAAHGAFSVLIRQLESAIQEPRLDSFISDLNSSVRAAGNGKSTMTLVLSLIDMDSGWVTTVNASHRMAYVYRRSQGFEMLSRKTVPALGLGSSIRVEFSTFQLQAGDVIFWYTDGLIERDELGAERMSKTELLSAMAGHADHPGADPLRTCEGLLGGLGKVADDVTVVVGMVPSEANFNKVAA